jgi:hypothetical protein
MIPDRESLVEPKYHSLPVAKPIKLFAMGEALLLIDGDSILMSLKISLAIAGLCALVLGMTMPLRLHTLWKRTRPVQISMQCEDPQALKFRLAEAVKSIGFQAPLDNGAGFTLEPVNWRKKLGASAIQVRFPGPRQALITGQAMVLSRPAKAFGVPLMAVPGTPTFGKFLWGKIKMLLWLVGGLFVVSFVLFLFVHPPRGGHKNELSPGERETPTLRQQ